MLELTQAAADGFPGLQEHFTLSLGATVFLGKGAGHLLPPRPQVEAQATAQSLPEIAFYGYAMGELLGVLDHTASILPPASALIPDEG